ncbi:MAG TPA: DUF3631 domain-containing protein [Candidatus Nitrosotalea sp.]|nr:DUF3631 domain-containing protein [Candidatus Nitrosotalea sp.]
MTTATPAPNLAELDRWATEALQPLSDLADFLGAFVAFPSAEAQDAVALWVLHTHAIGAASTTPRLSVRSAEKQCGKSRLLEVLELVAARPVLAVNISVAALFRSIGDPPPAILWDEVDALFRGGNDPGREDLRALLNSGYRRGASVLRMVGDGKKMEVRAFPTFAPVALAGIGELPDTVSDRSIIVELRRRLPGEKVRPFRRAAIASEAAPLRERSDNWAAENLAKLESARPAMPDGLSDRAEDLWEPLLAIADLVGGSWPKRARKAAVELAKVGRDRDGSDGVLLLTDLRAIFEAHLGEGAVPTATILEVLGALEESPWGDLRGKPLDARGLARRLRRFGVRPKQVRLRSVTVKGYSRADLTDAWARYLPPPPQSETSETAKHSNPAEVSEPALSRDQTPPDVSLVSLVSLPGRGGSQEPEPASNGPGPTLADNQWSPPRGGARRPAALDPMQPRIAALPHATNGHSRPDVGAAKLTWPAEVTRHGSDA